jgi:hypothetical protein
VSTSLGEGNSTEWYCIGALPHGLSLRGG